MKVRFNESVIFIYALLIVAIAGIGGGRVKVYAEYTQDSTIKLKPDISSNNFDFNIMYDSSNREMPFKFHKHNSDGTITMINLSNKSLWKNEDTRFVVELVPTGNAIRVSKCYELSDINSAGILSEKHETLRESPLLTFKFIGYKHSATKIKFVDSTKYRVTFNDMSLEEFNSIIKSLGPVSVKVKIHNKLIGTLILKETQNNLLHLQYNGSQEEFNLFNVLIESNDDFTYQRLTINSKFNYNTYSNSLQKVRLTKEFNMR